MRGLGRIWRRRNFAKDEDGAVTAEFLMIFPIYFFTVLTFFEAGWLMVQSAMLERGVESAVRDIRLGITEDPTVTDIRDRVCETAVLLGDCENGLMIELVGVPDAGSFPDPASHLGGAPDCVDNSGGTTNYLNPQDTFDPGDRNDIMFMRVCVLVYPWFPTTGLGLMLPKDSTGGVQMSMWTAFQNEPSD